MIELAPITLEDGDLIEGWLDNDPAGKKELSFYGNFTAWSKLLISPNRWGWIIKEKENKIGFIDLEKDLNNIGYFSFYLAQTERNKGKGKEVLLSLVQKAKELGVSFLGAGVNKNNIPSQKSLRSAGFVLEGTDKDGYLTYLFPIDRPKHS